MKISCIFTALDEVVKPRALCGPDSLYWEKYRDTARVSPKAYAEYESGLTHAAYWVWDLSESLRIWERLRAAAGSGWEANQSARATRRMYIKLYYRNNFKLIRRDINNPLTGAPSEIKLWLRWRLNDEVCVSSLHWHSLRSQGGFFCVILSFREKGQKNTNQERWWERKTFIIKERQRFGSGCEKVGQTYWKQSLWADTFFRYCLRASQNSPSFFWVTTISWRISSNDCKDAQRPVLLLTGYIAQLQSYSHCTVVCVH